MDDRQSIDLAAMLCSRLCHDMLSPVGALSNGLELLAMETDPEMRANVMELLEQSALISTNKLKFFRLAFGAAGGFGEQVEITESSGSRILDRATKELVSRLRFDAPPKELDSSSVPVHVIAPVDYDLSNS